jgi:glycoprotein endo-alpha-1,2-mannosidase
VCFLALVVSVAGAGCAHRAAAAVPQTRLPETQLSKQVLAFYYGWYGRASATDSWVHWVDADEAAGRIGNAAHYPTLGAYDSHDPRVIDQHFRWAKTAGITGFIVSWWGRDDFQDRGMPILLETARRFGLGISIYFEEVRPTNAPTPDGAIASVLYVLERYGRDPAWLKVNGRPVLFVYSRAVSQLTLEGWQTVVAQVNERYPGGAIFIGDGMSADSARIFDGIHTYNPTAFTARRSIEEIREWARPAFTRWIEIAGTDRIACVTLIAGYDDSTQGRSPPRPITDRHGGETYRVMWEAAIAANPDWVLICSWNEWHEGSEIEPSSQNGVRELDTTAAFAPTFLKMPLRPRLSRG